MSDGGDLADPVLAALAGAGGGDDMISARQDSSNLLVSTGPDVLWTPKGGGRVPVSYSVLAHMDTSTRLSTSVRNNGNYDFQLNSRTTTIVGHEPGTLKGVVIPGYRKYSHAETGADFLYSEGFSNVAHRDPAWINHDDEGPTEPRREIVYAQVADASGTQQPSGQNDAGRLLYDPIPLGPTQRLSPGTSGGSLFDPNHFSSLSPQQQQDAYDSLMGRVNRLLARRHVRRRRGGVRNRSNTRGNAQGSTNSGSTARPAANFGIQLMENLQQNQQFSVGQAAGFTGNAAGESGNFTQFHETIAAKKDKAGNILVPQHLAGPNEGGRGAIQWTAIRRRQFRQLIEREQGLPVDGGNTELPEEQYSNLGNNEAMINQDLNGDHQNAANAIRGGTPTDAVNNPIPSWVPNDDTARSTWLDFSEYERPGVYGAWARDDTNQEKTRAVQREFNRRLGFARSYYDEYLRTHTHGSQEQ